MNSRSRVAVAVLTVTYLMLAGAAVRDDRVLHDEGLLTHLLAELVGRAPLATVFLQKARPPLAVLYAPVAAAGLGPFLWAHVLVAAVAVPLVAATAQRLGQPRPEIAAAVVALSPMFIAAGAAGLMNADAVVGVAAVAFLWAAGRMLGAGLVMGGLVWVRAELAVLALVLAVVALVRREPRVLVGLAGFPLVYGLAGAAYHDDLWWMLRFPPALAEPMADNPFWHTQAGASLPTLMAAGLSICAALPLVASWRARDASEVERAGLVFCVVLFVALVGLPRWRVFNFDLSPRYLLPVLPFIALAVGRTATTMGPDAGAIGGLRRTVGLAVFAGLAVATQRSGGGVAALVAGLAAGAAMAMGGAGWSRGSMLVVGLGLAMGPLTLGPGARIARAQQAPALDPMVARLAEHPEWSDRPLYTNEPLLHAYLERGGAMPGRDVRFLVQADQLYELTSLSNPANGQRRALLGALESGFYGTPVWPSALTPEAVPEGAVFLLRDDPRLPLVMPPEGWRAHLQVVHPGRGLTIAVRAPARGSP